ncbi:aminoglycoside 6-adenylyltransferase [uncultured Desulfobulbus sp.]|uniref:aminoglycoside 6-adenylyltransferase n=1 Tax=uncultured Desulfobulbus sp. TaxID=239745 RepID=UPI0029C85A7D|nr:aminoglycoside 6-adenylyltransferase [uncultured Desulfobulbus sp.]
MHQNLRKVFDKTVEIFADDLRVIGAWIGGSGNAATEDVYSDVDPIFIIRDEDFNTFDVEMRSVFEPLVDEIILWWPERGNNDMVKNYAILFKAPELLQYDMNIMRESAFSSGWLVSTQPEQILFDKTGILRQAMENRIKSVHSPEKLLYNIELFWVYGYIIPKYMLRNQTFKIVYTQNVFFECHLEILHNLMPEVIWDWWPINVHRLLTPEKQVEMHRYFANADRESVAKVLPAELDAFSADARAACAKHGLAYPDKLESEVRAFIEKSGCLG